MPCIQLPHKWRPRSYQLPLWRYLQAGGRHAEAIWHRRSGKDEVALHHTACAAFERKANYWHMLPEYAQARKAIWDAVNPHTGIRRIDEAFPMELRSFTREQEMMIGFKSGSTWQVVGSDSYNKLVGATPAGIVFSEWAIANPAARAYLRPILAENNGWQLYIGTPRGKNHAYKTYQTAKRSADSFAQILSARDTGVFSQARLDEELAAYIDEHGEDVGRSLFEQEYMCSFDAAILGSFYGRELQTAEREGRITVVDVDEAVPVDVVFDIGWSDDTAIWFFQVVRGEIHVIDYYAANTQPIEHYAKLLADRGYSYRRDATGRAIIWLPHDGWAKTFASNGRSSVEQFFEYGFHCKRVPELSLQDGIQAARKALPRCWFDAEYTAEGLEALKLYRREYDADKKVFKDKPLHDWTSHAADSFRYLAIVWREMAPPEKTKTVFPVSDGKMNITLDDLWQTQPKTRRI